VSSSDFLADGPVPTSSVGDVVDTVPELREGCAAALQFADLCEFLADGDVRREAFALRRAARTLLAATDASPRARAAAHDAGL
jgi:hypothetical protein